MLYFLLLAAVAAAQSPDDLFRTQIQPVLERDCQGCHGAQMALSKLDLRTRSSLLTGGQRGPALLPGQAEASLLLHVIEGRNNLQMPPGGPNKKLPPETIAAFRQWIDAGAPWPDKTEAAHWTYKDEDLWAFRPLRPFNAQRSIDSFLDAQLAAKNLRPAPRADRRTLIRRATYDLTGLPPTPAEVAAFLADSSPNAWEKLIDRLLASPHYGERWGRHWLDVVRYADSGGYSNDFERPNAWRYRDYVIRSFNQDKPYDQFIREQIAGDELYPGNPEALLATGFLRSGPWEHTAMSVEAVTRQLFLDDVTHSTASTFLGLTLGCAKCHDHKFDPLPTRDYYRFQALFAATEFTRPPLPFLPSENTRDNAAGAAFVQAQYDHALARMAEFRREAYALLMKKHGVSRIEDLPKGYGEKAMEDGEGLDREKFETFKLFQKHSQIFKDSLDRYAPKAFAVSSGPSDEYPDGGPALKYPKRATYQPPTIHILPGGNVQSPTDPVEPGLLSLLAKYGNYEELPVPNSVSGRRSALALWIANQHNPLTARVMANRVWHYHFGRGLAADPSNFGKTGKKPSHPDLLDHLAHSFMAQHWSLKSLHKSILLSAAYQRSTAHPDLDRVRNTDPDNELLARFTPRRLEAEELRDSLLAVSGELSPDAGGPGVFPQINQDVARQPLHRMGSLAPAYHPSPTKRARNRRTIYTFQQRSLIDPLVEVFNGPSLDLSCERRDSSTVPTQAFALFNSQFTHDLALAFAARLTREASTLDAQITRAYQLAFQRPPAARELAAARAHYQTQLAFHRAHPAPPRSQPPPLVHKITSELTGEQFSFTQPEVPQAFEPNLHPSEVPASTRALSDLTLVLLNSSEFAYVY